MSGTIERAASQIADILMREGLDYTQTKAVFKQARAKAGLHAPKEHRGSPARLTLEEELRFTDQACAQGGQVGLMMQVLLEIGTRVSEFVALRVEDVSVVEGRSVGKLTDDDRETIQDALERMAARRPFLQTTFYRRVVNEAFRAGRHLQMMHQQLI